MFRKRSRQSYNYTIVSRFEFTVSNFGSVNLGTLDFLRLNELSPLDHTALSRYVFAPRKRGTNRTTLDVSTFARMAELADALV